MAEFVLSFNEGNVQGPPPPPPPTPETPPPPTAPQDDGDVNVLMVVLAYFGILSLIPFFAEKENAFVQFHARQGVTLFIAEIVAWVILLILSMIPVLGCIIAIIQIFFWLGVLIFHIILMVKAAKGERFKIPYISTYAERWFE